MSDEQPKIRLQNLRDFTVQIRHATTDAIVGTGIVVSMDGKIVTCAHVVEVAGVDLQDVKSTEVGVYFPQASPSEIKKRRATVVAYFPKHDDDIVILQLVGAPSPLAPEQIAVLGNAKLSEGNPFRSYGYRRLADYTAGFADGKILGEVEPPEGRFVQSDPVQLKSSEINQGMSGAAVLDINENRNLVVGIISETWFPDLSTKDRDTAWAVNAKVLSFHPFNQQVQDTPHPLLPAPHSKSDIETAQEVGVYPHDLFLDNAPQPLEEWVGREELLKRITTYWADMNCHITGLIGFGGEGKSSLARRWLDNLLVDSSQTQPAGIFWWSFNQRPNVDEFFEAALKYLIGKKVKPRHPLAIVHLIAGMLYEGRYIFVLDGLETIQYQESDQYGLLMSIELRKILEYFADPKNQSFCLITSRTPVLDLMEYTTYNHVDVTGLNTADGRSLLRKLGVNGKNEELDKVVQNWDGHALTLSILGNCLVDTHDGDISFINEVPMPTADEPRYDLVRRVLHHYDEHMTKDESTFLMISSAFRLPVHESAFEIIFRRKINDMYLFSWDNVPGNDNRRLIEFLKQRYGIDRIKTVEIEKIDDDRTIEVSSEKNYLSLRLLSLRLNDDKTRVNIKIDDDRTDELIARLENSKLNIYKDIIDVPLASLDDNKFSEMVKRQEKRHILRYNQKTHNYTIKPLIRAYYYLRLAKSNIAQKVHRHIKDYYLEISKELPQNPTLDDLIPFIEIVHHTCCAGDYTMAWNFYKNRINGPKSYVLTNKLGAYETALALMRDFFPDGDFNKEPFFSKPGLKANIIGSVGFSLMSLGLLSDALSLYKRYNAVSEKANLWWKSSNGYLNLARLYIHLGELESSINTAYKGLEIVKNRKHSSEQMLNLLCILAWAYHLKGNLEKANEYFMSAEKLNRSIYKNRRYLSGFRGIYHADYLRRIGNRTEAMIVVAFNKNICEKDRLLPQVSRCYRILGDLEATVGQHQQAHKYYYSALKIAHDIFRRDILIEALLAQGRWKASLGEAQVAFSYLIEALDYAIAGGYRIYEANIRAGMALAYLAEGSRAKAQYEAEYARSMSIQMGYHWGQEDAENVLATLDKTN